MSRNNNSKQKTPLVTHLVAGGAAGLMEACTCHPLDTIKVRMQLSKSGSRSATVSIHIRKQWKLAHGALSRVNVSVSWALVQRL